MDRAQVLAEAYLRGVTELRAAVEGLSREHWLARPIPGRWSTLEVLAHLADFEPIMADRILRVLSLPKPLLLAADENLFYERLHYQTRQPEEELAVIEAIRRKHARIIRSLSAEQLQRTGVHSEKGLVTLEQLIEYAIQHIPHHLSFIYEKRKALGLD